MSDLDADLLALAGDSSDNDGKVEEPSKATGKAISPTASNASAPDAQDTASLSAAHDQSHNASTNPSTSKKRASTSDAEGERAGKKSRRGESDEEGEASSRSASTSSLHSASMSESDSGADRAGAKDGTDKVGVGGRSVSAAEKAKIMSLPEVQREEFLADKATATQREKQNRMLMRLLRDKERKEEDDVDTLDRERRSVQADTQVSQRKSTRQKTTLGGRKVGHADVPLEEYKKAREARDRAVTTPHGKKVEHATRKRGRGKDAGGSDADAESDFDRLSSKRSTPPQQSTPTPQQPDSEVLSTLREINRARVGRHGFGAICCYPGFDETIAGCFVRVSIGQHPETGVSVYRMGQVKEFTEGLQYAIAAPNRRKFVTKQYAMIAIGKTCKPFPFVMFSDSDITMDEYGRYLKTCVADSVPFPMRDFVVEKVNAINKLLTRTWTPAEIQAKLEKGNVIRLGNSAIHVAAIRAQQRGAKLRGDEARYEELEKELEEFFPKLAWGTTLDYEYDGDRAPTPPPKPKPVEEDYRVAMLRRRRIREALYSGTPRKRFRTPRIKSQDGSPSTSNADDLSENPSDLSRGTTPDKKEPAVVMPKFVHKEWKTPEGLPMLGPNPTCDDYLEQIDLGIEIEL